ncbi:MAG: guanylate kinase [Candidatus Zixiibacteriota bacterium]
MFNDNKIFTRHGFLLILSAPSGAGKTTIYKKMLEKYPDLEYSVSTTTRKMRNNEKNGTDYVFVSEDEFKSKIKNDDFAEWAKVHGNYYGTDKTNIEKALKKRKILIFDIDVQGALQLKEIYKDNAVLVFIITPSYNELKNRLKSRCTDSEKDIDIRLKNARWEFSNIHKYDYVVINDEIEDAINVLETIIRAESSKLSRIDEIEWKGIN